ncbi:MAG: RimK family alpha-L-glutamate ligase [Candidatus Woesearchaeota archaeon]
MKAAIISMGSKSSEWVAEELKKLFDAVEMIDIRHIEVSLSHKRYEVLYKGKAFDHFDCLYLKGSYRYAALLRTLTKALHTKAYMPIKASAFTTGHDKLLTHIKLQQYGIPQPTTYLASGIKAAKNILKKISYPIVMKIPSGTQGKGVMFADSFASASSLLDALHTLRQPFIVQEYIETGGVDIRAIVIGDKVVASMQRKAVVGEKRANIHAGATGEPCVLDDKTKRIAIDTASAVGADICAVDLLISSTGPLVIEINLSPGLQGITNATKINVAEKIAGYLFRKTKEMVEGQKSSDSMKVMQEISCASNEIITSVSMRGERILLPEIVTKLSKITEKDELVLKVEKGSLTISRMKK